MENDTLFAPTETLQAMWQVGRLGVETERAKMTNPEMYDLLNELDAVQRIPGYRTANGWATPHDIGGHSRSPIGRQLMRMVKLGYVETRQRGGFAIDPRPGARGSREYRVTYEGQQFLRSHSEVN